MSITAAKLMVVVGGDVSQAQGALGILQRAMGGLGGIAQTALGFLSGQLMMNGINMLKDLGSEALDSYASYERLGLSLQSLAAREMVNSGEADTLGEAMAGAAGKAEELQGWIQKLAIESPFTQQGVADAFRTTLAYGFATEEAQRLTEAMIDFAAGSGATESSMSSIALALGQIQAKGKLGGQEVLQLVNAGLAVDQILADAFGKSTAEIVEMREKGLIPADEAIEAIVSSLEEDFGGAAARQAGTFSGLISSLSDIKSVGLREFFAGTFEAIQPYVQSFVDTLSDPATMASIRGIGENLGQFVGDLIPKLMALPGQVQAFFDAFRQNETVQIVAQTVGAAFEKLGEFWTENGPGIVETVGQFFGTIAELGSQLGEQVLPFLAGEFYKVSAWFEQNGPLIGEFVQVVLTGFGNIATAAVGMWSFIQPALSGIINNVLGIGKAIMQMATGDWSGAWETIKNTSSQGWDAVRLAFTNFADWVLGTFLGTSWANVVSGWSQNWDMFKQIVKLGWEAIVLNFSLAVISLAENIGKIKTKIGEFVTNTIKPFQTAFDNVKASIMGVVEWIGNLIKKLAGVVIPDWAERHSPSPIEQTFGNWLEYTRSLVHELPRVGQGMQMPAMAGGQAGGQGASYQTTVSVNAQVSQELDMYVLAQRVAEEIRRSRL